ncbi:unnamed protein product [Ceutorhynchus assimilis]|uniref:Uncharacterized protein n=1 Tax=Ceutorhynchus assimilis TaxID=467358 RepID=A0A9N9MI59_9CUCU|nr:unnamed protein product [Ceutorhynchus assimilis]
MTLTISLSRLNLVNIEFFEIQEITLIETKLLETYHEDQLLYSINHPYELLEQSTIITCMHNSVLRLILKIPILKPQVQSLYQIFPLTRADDTMLLNPTEFYSNKVWYDKCILHKETKYICSNPRPSNCSFDQQIKSCLHVKLLHTMDYYKITQNFVVITNRDPATIGCPTSWKCNMYIVNRNCSVDPLPYQLPQVALPELPPSFQIHLEEIRIPGGTHLEAVQRITLPEVVSWTVQSVCGFLFLTLLLFVVIKRKRIHRLFIGSKPTVAALRSVLRGEELCNQAKLDSPDGRFQPLATNPPTVDPQSDVSRTQSA